MPHTPLTNSRPGPSRGAVVFPPLNTRTESLVGEPEQLKNCKMGGPFVMVRVAFVSTIHGNPALFPSPSEAL